MNNCIHLLDDKTSAENHWVVLRKCFCSSAFNSKPSICSGTLLDVNESFNFYWWYSGAVYYKMKGCDLFYDTKSASLTIWFMVVLSKFSFLFE